MTPQQIEEMKKCVDAHGWIGLRALRPDLWALYLADRKDAHKYVDAAEKAECERVGA